MKLISKYFEPFNPQCLQKIFKKKDQFGAEAHAAVHDINNTPKGLYDYISAPNIKHKVSLVIIS